jgi:hypothetical protein
MTNDDNTPKLPHLKVSDFEDTLEGELPGNNAAEHGNEPGASSESIAEGHNPGEVARVAPEALEAKREAIEERVEAEAGRQFDRQVKEYEAGIDDGKG